MFSPREKLFPAKLNRSYTFLDIVYDEDCKDTSLEVLQSVSDHKQAILSWTKKKQY